MLVVKGNKTIKKEAKEVFKSIEDFEKVVIDLGTGDGRFVYKNALVNPQTFYIGIDPSESQLKISARDVQRKKLSNILLVVGSIEHLPEELKNIADEIYVNFPWGSLLETFVKPNTENLINLAKILKKEGIIKVIFGYDELLEPSETKRMGLPTIDLDYIKDVLTPKYKSVGLKISEFGTFDRKAQKVETSWYKRLKSDRTWFYCVIQII
jgi:16S rRNA (adenine(1408)-N(1))-methyltransferase